MNTAQEWIRAIEGAITARHPRSADWFLFFELRAGTGFASGAEQRFDAFAMNALPSFRFERTAYEIKVSRSDFLSEMKKPAKRRRAMRFSNKFYFITPPGIAQPHEIPLDCGLIEVTSAIQHKVIVPAPDRDSLPPTWLFIASLLRRAHQRMPKDALRPGE